MTPVKCIHCLFLNLYRDFLLHGGERRLFSDGGRFLVKHNLENSIGFLDIKNKILSQKLDMHVQVSIFLLEAFSHSCHLDPARKKKSGMFILFSGNVAKARNCAHPHMM